MKSLAKDQRVVSFLVAICILTGVSPESVPAQPLNGTKVISGSGGGNYTTISDAVTDLITEGVDGPLVFEIVDGTYNEQVTLPSITGASALNTITFQAQPATACGVNWWFSATDAGDNWVVQLQGADYLTFKDICFTAGGTSFGRIFDISSGSDNNSIIDCTLNGGVTTSTSDDLALIFISGLNKNNTLSGSTLNNGSYGIRSLGSATKSAGTAIFSSIFMDQYKTAIYLAGQESPHIEVNQIINRNSNVSYRGIFLQDCDGASRIVKNRLHMSDGFGIWCDACQGAQGDEGLIANNFLLSDGANRGRLLQFQNSQYFNVLYNSLVNTGNGGTAFSTIDAATANINVKNNLVIQLGGGAAFGIAALSNLASSDYNDLYSSGAKVAVLAGATHTTLTSWQNASSQDANSISKPVVFANVTIGNLHLAGSSLGDLDLIGTPVPSVTDDYDGEPRDALYPYKGADEDLQNPLPVELSSFTVRADKNTVILNWVTISETNNFGFEVQRQQRSEEWHKAGFVPGQGTTTEANLYGFTDHNVPPGEYHYRLKQIDTDGSFDFSGIVTAVVGVPNNFSLLQNFPNPFNPETTIRYSLSQSSVVSLAVFDLLGRKVRTLMRGEQKDAGYFTANWDGRDDAGHHVASGVYICRIIAENQVLSRKMILMR